MSRAFDPVQLGSIELFCKAAELGGFSAAAQALGLTPAAVSRSIARLEARLGVRLFERTTRSIRLTDDGALYQAECRQALEQIAQAERALSGQRQAVSGLLRISLPTTYARYRVMALLPRFMQAHPEVELEVHVGNRNVDFIDDGFDLAVRLGEPQDSRLVARTLEDATLGLFAAPAYLARRGVPRSLAELAQHDCIQFVRPSTGRPMGWLFRDGAREFEYTYRSRQRVLDDVLGCVDWARAGGGLFQTYHYIADESVRRGELVEVLQAHAGRSRRFSILYPQNRHLSARVRAFVDFLLQSLEALRGPGHPTAVTALSPVPPNIGGPNP